MLAGSHVALDLYPEHLALLRDPKLWLAKLDRCYEAMAELVGQVPFRGERIIIREVDTITWEGQTIECAMLSGNPVQWLAKLVPERMRWINEHDDLSFGPPHELGHDFDLDGWNYYGGEGPINGEHWANFKATFVCEAVAAQFPGTTMIQEGLGRPVPVGRFPHQYFVEGQALPWIKRDKKDWNEMTNDVFTGLLYLLRERYGWEPFQKMFRFYGKWSTRLLVGTPKHNLDKVSLLAWILSRYTKEDLVPQFREWGFPI